MKYVLLSAERSHKNSTLIRDALMVMHECEESFHFSSDNTPFTVENTGRVTTLSIDDSHSKFKEIVDNFTSALNKRRAFSNAQISRVKKSSTRKTPALNDRLAAVFRILNKKDDEIFISERTNYVSVSIRGKHTYSVEQMRKLCTLLKKFDPTFTCKSNHFVITISI